MEWVVNATPRPLYPREKDPVPILREGRCAPGPIWTGAEDLAPPGFDPRTVQPVANRYTDYAIPAHTKLGRLCRCSGVLVAGLSPEGKGSISCQSLWDWWCTELQWERFISEYFMFYLSV
jgi:hypothetical protein